MQQLHGTCVALDGAAILLTGPSGAGKSDLALRLIGQGAVLVADDYLLVEASAGAVHARAPEAIAGLLEVRGLGLVKLPYAAEPTPIRLIARLVGREEVERLPDPAYDAIAGHELPVLKLFPFEASACAKLKLALRAACGTIEMVQAKED